MGTQTERSNNETAHRLFESKYNVVSDPFTPYNEQFHGSNDVLTLPDLLPAEPWARMEFNSNKRLQLINEDVGWWTSKAGVIRERLLREVRVSQCFTMAMNESYQ